MNVRFSLFFLLSAVSLPSFAVEPPASARERHTAECVAALREASVQTAEQVRQGREELRPSLLAQLELGAAIVGSAYLAGDRDEARAKQLLEEAARARATLAPSAQSQQVLTCSQEAAVLLKGANFFERAVVARMARLRMGRLLPSSAASSG